ncbi:MAG: hypothetical protein AAB473_01125 [Patescibacteria group bacterium]
MELPLRACSRSEAAGRLDLAVLHAAGRIGPLVAIRDRTRTGGFFAYWRRGEIPCVICFEVRRPSGEQVRKYAHHALEKAERLSRHPDHVSSFQTRDVTAPDKRDRAYGGAIALADDMIFSFSGFSEEEDEAVCVLAARELGLMDDELVERIIAASNNEGLRDQIAAMRDANVW